MQVQQQGGGQGRMFGEIAVALGCLSPEQLAHALAVQRSEAIEQRPYRPVGEICVALEYLTPDQVREILARQEVPVLRDA